MPGKQVGPGDFVDVPDLMYDSHIVTAPEAAYKSLTKWFLWTGNREVKNHDLPSYSSDEWRYLHSISCVITDASGDFREGCIVGFEAPYFRGTFWHEQLHRGVQHHGIGVRYAPAVPFPVYRGVGIRLMLGSVQTSDCIQTVIVHSKRWPLGRLV